MFQRRRQHQQPQQHEYINFDARLSLPVMLLQRGEERRAMRQLGTLCGGRCKPILLMMIMLSFEMRMLSNARQQQKSFLWYFIAIKIAKISFRGVIIIIMIIISKAVVFVWPTWYNIKTIPLTKLNPRASL